MDGFKNSTKTRYDTTSGKTFANGGTVVSRNDMAGGQGPMSKPAMVAKYAKGGAVKKIEKVMGEFKSGKLHSGSKHGPEVTSKKQATAIALSEARKAGAKIPMKKNNGGSVEADDVLMSRMTKDELAQGARGVRMARERLERQSVKRGVPPSSDKPLISPRMQEVGKSIGVTKKAAGGLTLSNVPQSARLTLSNVPTTQPPEREVIPTRGLTLSNVPKTAPAAAPTRGLTLARTAPARRGLTLGMNKGGLSAMPKGKKGC